MNETVDLRPDHNQLRNLFRQIQPAYLVASGSNSFLEELIQLLDLPEGTEINKYKVQKTKAANASAMNVSFFPFNRKNQQEGFRKRIYELDLPGLPAESSRSDRQIFMDSVFKMDQELLVLVLGNLLKYLQDNHMKWRHIFLNLDKSPIITNVVVLNVQSQVLVDDATLKALNIFSIIHHPSSFKTQVRYDGISLFNMLNKCSSSAGVQELKAMLKQPTSCLSELNLRLSTVEWCLQPENSEHVLQLRGHLSNLLNVNSIVSRIITNHGRTGDWKSLKKTVYFSFMAVQLCGSLSKKSICGTVLQDLAGFATDEPRIEGMLFALDKIVDLDGIEEKRRFIVKESLDADLDGKRESLKEMTTTFMAMEPDESLANLATKENAFGFVYFPEMGFVIGTGVKVDEMNLPAMESEEFELVLQTMDATYFRTPNCKQLNEEYERQMSDVIQHEMRVFNRLVTFINENLAELIDITKLCAKLDVLLSFAYVSAAGKFVRPTLTTNKEVVIVNGRHPLVELIREYVPSTTVIDGSKRNFINIISAPNASGKSIYMKQVGLVCYMAHIGMFVPADECRIGSLDSIYTRIFTPQSVYQCESAFMADLQQMSKVIMNSTSRSLVLIDEFGKGTHYKDGTALLAACIENFEERGDLTPIAFITTHYGQVCDMIKSKAMTSLKSIVTRKNDAGVYESLFELSSGANNQSCFTEFPESIQIMGKILNQKDK